MKKLNISIKSSNNINIHINVYFCIISIGNIDKCFEAKE